MREIKKEIPKSQKLTLINFKNLKKKFKRYKYRFIRG